MISLIVSSPSRASSGPRPTASSIRASTSRAGSASPTTVGSAAMISPRIARRRVRNSLAPRWRISWRRRSICPSSRRCRTRVASRDASLAATVRAGRSRAAAAPSCESGPASLFPDPVASIRSRKPPMRISSPSSKGPYSLIRSPLTVVPPREPRSMIERRSPVSRISAWVRATRQLDKTTGCPRWRPIRQGKSATATTLALPASVSIERVNILVLRDLEGLVVSRFPGEHRPDLRHPGFHCVTPLPRLECRILDEARRHEDHEIGLLLPVHPRTEQRAQHRHVTEPRYLVDASGGILAQQSGDDEGLALAQPHLGFGASLEQAGNVLDLDFEIDRGDLGRDLGADQPIGARYGADVELDPVLLELNVDRTAIAGLRNRQFPTRDEASRSAAAAR